MNGTTESAAKCSALLGKTLSAAWRIKVQLFVPPYGDLSKVDSGLRSIMWRDFRVEDIPDEVRPSEENRFLIVESVLNFFEIIAYLALGEHPTFLSIGPFRSEKIDADKIRSRYSCLTVDKARMRPETITPVSDLPLAPAESVIEISLATISTFFPEFESLAPRLVSFPIGSRPLDVNESLLEVYGEERTQSYRDSLMNLLSAILSGSSDAAASCLKEFQTVTAAFASSSIYNARTLLGMLNGYIEVALFSSSVHPAYVISLYEKMNRKISEAETREELKTLPSELCQKYCLLARTFSYEEYSSLIRSVANHIRMHLEEDLSLRTLSSLFEKSPAALSSQFSKETGIGIADYVRKERVSKAKHLFETSPMSVSEIAVRVGFEDFSYFSKCFRKETGLSPREYAKRTRRVLQDNP